MPVVFCGICPHPPIMVPEVGKKEADVVIRSRQSMLDLGRRLKESGAQSVIMISPHGPVFSDGIAINMNSSLTGDLKRFAAGNVSFDLENDLDLAHAIQRAAQEEGIVTVGLKEGDAWQYGVRLELDHGLMVPLYFLTEAGVNLPITVLYMGFLPYDELYRFGMSVQKAVEKTGKKVAVLASGDLSHRLTAGAPAGYDPRGEEFDREIVRLMETVDTMGVLNLDSEWVERAGECGLRPLIMMLGSLDGLAVESEVLSYEGPFGVGYLVAVIKPGTEEPNRKYGHTLYEKRRLTNAERKSREGYLPSLARSALEQHSRGKQMKVPLEQTPPDFRQPAGVFVSLKKQGQLRGCIGTISPQHDTMVEETIRNAISAGHQDSRFYPVEADELDDLDISVDVLYAPEEINSEEELDPTRYGVIVQSGRKQGLLLPNLEGVNTVEEQVEIAKGKAGIAPGEPYRLKRFEVVRHR